MRSAPINTSYIKLADCRRGRRLFGLLALISPLLIGQANAAAGTPTNTGNARWILAQNTTEATTSSELPRTPRVISKPQTVVEGETTGANPNSVTNKTTGTTKTTETPETSQPSGGSDDVLGKLLAVLPDTWQQKIEQFTGGTAAGSNDELVKKIALPIVAVIAVLFLLPFFLVALLRRLFRRRPAEAIAATTLNQEHLADLDLDDIDLTGAVSSNDNGKRAEHTSRQSIENVESASKQTAPHLSPTTEPETAAETAAVWIEPEPAPANKQVSKASRQAQALDEDAFDNHDLSANPALHDATVEIHEADLPQKADELKEKPNKTEQTEEIIGTSTAVQSAIDETYAAETTPETPGNKGREEMTGMQQQHFEGEPTRTQLPVTNSAEITEQSQQPMTKFGLWLNDLPNGLGAQYSTEALLYWISYGAGNVDPQLREELNNATELDDRGRIKRAVLSAKPEIFNDVLLSIHKRYSPAQQLQLLDLMLAVLVTGEGIKPVENLMLRFFCDYTGIGTQTLENRYRDGFDSELPGIPRPDRLKWWDMQPAADGHNDNARAGGSRLFGLSTSASESRFQRAYKLAEHRHDPSRFDLLGEKQRSLALRNLQKYQNALQARMEQEA